MERTEIYLDNAAAAGLAPEAAEAYLACEREARGNASSVHAAGVAAAKRVEAARLALAAELRCLPEELVFTSGGTESNNAALKGLARANRARGRLVAVSATEHPSVLAAARSLAGEGFEIIELGVGRDGVTDLSAVRRAVAAGAVLVSVMHASNETGVLQPVAEIAALCRERGALFHTDACQSFLKEPVDCAALGVDALSLSAHKVHGPKGVGALFLRKGVAMEPLLHGGGQEGGLRSGTYNAAGIAAFAAAAAACRGRYGPLRGLLDDFCAGLAGLPGVSLNGSQARRLCNIVSVAIAGVPAKKLLQALSARGVYISAGSACSAGSEEPSHVRTAMGLTPEQANSSIRFSAGAWTTRLELDAALAAIKEEVLRLRGGANG